MYQTGIFIDAELLKRTDLTPSEKLYVAAARVSPNITQEEIAKMVGLSSRTIRRIEGQLLEKNHSITPVPEQLPTKTRKKKADNLSGARGTRIDDNFCPTAHTVRWANRFPKLDVDVETEKFINYWSGISGAKGVKLDWDRTFRNWLINGNTYMLQGEARNKAKSGIWDDITTHYERGYNDPVRPVGCPILGSDEPSPW